MQASSARRGVQPAVPQAPNSPFAAPQLASMGFVGGAEAPHKGQSAHRTASELGDLELANRACSIASVRSNGSFNSEEGFGSPSTNKRLKNRSAMPEMAESSFEVGLLSL